VTPDLLPLIGRDPSHPALIYACGHSRNGVLLAPITAEIVARIVFEERLNFDLGQFDPARFKGTFTKP
jgi:glycine/D-amino acid oxidase-like deaminating enzyme